MHFTKASLCLVALPLALAAECTVSDSSPWPFGDSSSDDGPAVGAGGGSVGSGGAIGTGGSGGGGSITDTCAQFENDASAYQACTENALGGQCNAAGGCGGSDTSDLISDSGDDLISSGGDDLISSGDSDSDDLIRRLRVRQTLTCTDDETCYSFSGSLRCYDPASGAYRDDSGASGNALEGSYTDSDNSDSDDSDSDTQTTGSSSSATTTDSADTAASTNGGQQVKAGAILGSVALFVAFLL